MLVPEGYKSPDELEMFTEDLSGEMDLYSSKNATVCYRDPMFPNGILFLHPRTAKLQKGVAEEVLPDAAARRESHAHPETSPGRSVADTSYYSCFCYYYYYYYYYY